MKRIVLAAVMTCAGLGMAAAQSMNDQIISDLQSKGYEYIEIKNGPTQTKVEAIRGTDKLEVVYDNASGSIIKQEREAAEQGEVGQSGVDISTRDDEFVDLRDEDDDEDENDDHSGSDGHSNEDDDDDDDDGDDEDDDDEDEDSDNDDDDDESDDD